MPPKKQKGGKGKTDDWDDDAAEKKLAALAVTDNKSDKDAFSDSEDDAPPPPKASNRMAAFMMASDSDGASEKGSDDEEEKKEKSPVKKEQPAPAADKKDKKKKKGGKKEEKKDEDDELDALMANLDKKEEKGPGKKAKKKEKKEAALADAEAAGEERVEGGEEKGTEEPKADADDKDDDGKKKKKKKKKGGKEKSETPGGEEEGEAEAKEEKEEGEEKKDDDDEEGDDKKKKKKDKKKKDDKKDGKKDKKSKHVDMIKEMLRQRQEIEEAEAKRRQEEEEKFEALAKAKEEEERLLREKKEREKQKKKEKEEELKRQGKYLTPAQKEKLRRQQQMLASGNFQLPVGVTVGEGEEGTAEEEKPKKRILYGKKKADKKKDSPPADKEVTPPVPVPVPAAPEPPKEPSPVAEEPAADWEEKDEEPLDDWEMASEHEEAEEKAPVPAPAAKAAAPSGKAAAPTGGAIPGAVLADKASLEKQKSQDEESSSEESSSDDEDSSDDSDSDSEESSSEDEKGGNRKETKEQMVERVRARLKKRRDTAIAKKSLDVLRAPIICVLGHVDTGKTKMLDNIRRTNVQDGEAGGITQQIGATQVPIEAIKERCKAVRDFDADAMKLPGFLIIDTPGHESFSNLRSRGSSLCDFAILVVDIMHGLEQQTIESLKLLLKRGTPFVIALNKIDRLYMYESSPRKDIYAHLKSQPQSTQMEFKSHFDKIVVEFAEQGVNVCLSNNPKADDDYIRMVPTSAMQGDGVGNIMSFIAYMAQTKFADKLAFVEELDASVMEVKAIPGLGTTIDVILVNGTLRVGDAIVLTGTDGPIVTQIRELLMPQPLREMRVKNEYEHYKSIRGAQGVKILGKNLEKALAGLPLFVAQMEDEIALLQDDAERGLSKALMAIKKKPEGVYVQASTLGSLEALLEFLKSQKIPYANVNIGPVHKKDVQKATVMLEHNPEYACILAFDVKVEKDAQLFADHNGIRIFQADIIYHLEDNFLKYREELRMKARKEHEHLAIFPCKLRIMPQHVFNARNPIVVGVSIEAGQLKKGTPICVPSKEGIHLGAVASIERNHEQVDVAKAGEEVCIKIENTTGDAPKLYGRHFTHEDILVSRITRESIDVCKTYFRDDLTTGDWRLVVELKKLLDIF